MKAIGLVFDLQTNKMWLRTQPNLKYDISSDLINAGRIDVSLLSTQLRTGPPYHIAIIQVKTSSSLSADTCYPGQYLAIADLYDGDNNEITHALPILSLTTTTPTSSTFNFNKNNSFHLISYFT
ncbi:unnamed protein product [Rotaria sp. Silwood1]|nr:unnamed protein product [Rotaria sp. Silwood1]CAF5045728.1 unnamed protein product [Rotaria sp. Silwood1]